MFSVVLMRKYCTEGSSKRHSTNVVLEMAPHPKIICNILGQAWGGRWNILKRSSYSSPYTSHTTHHTYNTAYESPGDCYPHLLLAGAGGGGGIPASLTLSHVSCGSARAVTACWRSHGHRDPGETSRQRWVDTTEGVAGERIAWWGRAHQWDCN